MSLSKLTRRQFARTSGGAAAVSLSTLSWSSLAHGGSPLTQLRVGVIGTGVRGKYLIGNLPPKTRVVAICDCAQSRMAETIQPRGKFVEVLESFKNTDARNCRRYQDYRRMLDDAKLDAVIIATPDHHHVQAAMLAIQAGLDVYLEKPLSLTIGEGKVLVDAVKATGRVLQVGSQQRTMEVNRFACEFIRNGGLGTISQVDLPNYPGPLATSKYPAEPGPEGFDWNLFLGPTPTRPHNQRLWVKDAFRVDGLLWRGWDLFRDYSGHLMTNWGGHNVDMVQYALGADDSGPTKIEPLAGVSEEALNRDWRQKWHKKTPPPFGRFSADQRFSPIRLTYDNGTQLNLLPAIGTATFRGERGHMAIARNRFDCQPADLVKDAPDPGLAEKWKGAGFVARPHLQNWLDCIVSRHKPNASVEIGHRTATVCHLVNIARELNRPLHWDPANERFIDDEVANGFLDRPRRHGFELPKVA